MRINKYLADQGVATRREADKLIEKGKVFINGHKAELGDQVEDGDEVEVRQGKPKELIYIAYNKPRGVVTHSPQGQEESIADRIGRRDVFPVGRLDKDSHGLIILTNDGRVTSRLLSPEHKHEKEYLVKVKDKLRSSFKDKIEAGVQIEQERTAPAKVKVLGDKSFKIILTEGKRHQIRRMCVALFNEVVDLERIRVGSIKLGKLPEGASRELKGEELDTFLKSLGLA